MPAFTTGVIIKAPRSVEAACRAPTDPVRLGGTCLLEARASAIRLVCHEGAV